MDLKGACRHIQDLPQVAKAKRYECDECVTIGDAFVEYGSGSG